jgi:hypothetical protein
MRATITTAALVTVLAATAACSGEGGNTVTAQPNPTRTSAPETRLEVTVQAAETMPPKQWTLSCDPPGGDHPDAAAACAALEKGKAPFAPVPKDMACTQISGGPQTATITGTWRGERVTASYNRSNGCEIARWDRLIPVFQDAGGEV